MIPVAVVHAPAVNAHLAGQPLVVVCSWHTPLPELLALGRQYPGMVSHVLCPSCAARFEQAVK